MATLAFGDDVDDAALEKVVHALVVRSAGDATFPAVRAATNLLMSQLAAAWEGGWQPADLVHIVRRHQPIRIVALAGAAIVELARRDGWADRAPADWLAQLDTLAARSAVPEPWLVMEWHRRNGTAPWDGWRDTLALIGQLQRLRRLTALGPTPAQWPSVRRTERRVGRNGDRPGVGAGRQSDPRMLDKIRALLAKAEATTFSDEADAFTAKAQDLMTRYSIDEALLDDAAGAGDVPARRIHIDNPYAEAKVQLLSTVGDINRVRVVWDAQHGMATAVGMPVDLQLVEMLFTSLLVQATREMTHAGNARSTDTAYQGGRLNRSPSFRRAFLLAFAHRIGERLEQAGRRAGDEAGSAVGAALVPVLIRRTAAVDAAFARLFPQTQQRRATRVNARGWDAGRAAADKAVLAAGQVAAADQPR